MGTTTTKIPHPSDALTGFQIDGMTPFLGRGEAAAELIKQARSLCLMLGVAFRDADAESHSSDFSSLRDIFKSQSFDAIHSLLGVALFLQTDGVSC